MEMILYSGPDRERSQSQNLIDLSCPWPIYLFMHLLIVVKTVSLAHLRNRVDRQLNLVSASEYVIKEYFWKHFRLAAIICRCRYVEYLSESLTGCSLQP